MPIDPHNTDETPPAWGDDSGKRGWRNHSQHGMYAHVRHWAQGSPWRVTFMLAELAKVYDVPFEKDRVRTILAAVIGGYTAANLGYGAGGSLLKGVPLIGTALGVLAVPAFAAGLTFAVGKIFTQHFASGGTFLDFDPETVRQHFQSAA